MDDLSANAFRLLDLPAELRLTILSYYFGERTMTVNLCAAAPAQKRFFSLVHKERKQNVVAVLQTCRRLSKEAYEILWNSTTFVIRIAGHFSLGKQPKPVIPLQRIRHAVMNVGYVPKDSTPELEALLHSFESLKTADVHFDFTAPEFAYPWLTDCIVWKFVDGLKIEKLGRVSCVAHDRSGAAPVRWYHGKEMRSLMPYSCPAFEELKREHHP
jgi:hypothetical protein